MRKHAGRFELRDLSGSVEVPPTGTADPHGMSKTLIPPRDAAHGAAAAAIDVPGRSASLWHDHAAPVRRTARRLRPVRPRPLVVDVLAALAGIGLGITIGLEVTAESAGSLAAPGGVATALGRLTGLLAAYAMVVVVLLVARVPPLERAISQDRLAGLHRPPRPVP